ncbi:NADP-dependent malic enzyme [Wenzhouxiangella sp. XN79A]|uniref:NADP-dependent malic enzyme n=1 Tax=Wenzhouxiangella sp. XN79A TaxID=2724193 RepID=UPI00144A5321|nr:NADP-dependent malic enzyme [Wenzhouxiangella sp. XN79A]NKI35641.1 NADP-dependent malic enzyme [Wenzhouxiangella sp. XN79A]
MSDFDEQALDYHRYPTPGKIKIVATKALTTQKDLALAYSPGVAAACRAIVDDPLAAREVTSRGNLVAVISNGTAVLGLGNIGPLAAKPVMEGKAVLFKKFADIDVFDIEIDEQDPDKLIDIVASLEPTFGGINLEDIKAPECFHVEESLKERMNIPVFHDDQHGTAIITAAAIVNGLQLVGKKIEKVRLVASGAGAAGMACLDLLVTMGLNKENIVVCDREGVVYTGREIDMDDRKAGYAIDTDARTLDDVIGKADIFLGVSAPGVLKPSMVERMAKKPIILALANPVPEIMPDVAREARPDALIATGRSDFPNQVNNVLCFPYIFRGALDVGATVINDEMKMACVHAIAELARMEASDVAAAAYGGEATKFGPDYLIPQPFDPRLLVQLAPAVAKAAMDSGVATRPIEDLEAYRERLSQYVFRTGLLMKPVFDAARKDPKRVVFAEGEEETVLRAVQTIVDDGLARPILVGRPSVVDMRIERAGLRIRAGEHFELVNPESDPRFKDYWQTFHRITERRGVTPDSAKAIVRTRNTVIAAIMVYRNEADALICGVVGRYQKKLQYVTEVLGLREDCATLGALSAMTNESGTYFVCDTHVNPDPTAEQLADITLMAAEKVRMFGITPKVALLSHSSFGSHVNAQASKMRRVLQLVRERAPELEIEGEMRADAALMPKVRERVFPNSMLTGQANLFVMPDQDAAHIAFNMARVIGKGVNVGPILMGAGRPAHVLTPSATVRRVVNMTAIAVFDAQMEVASQVQK